MLFVKWRSHYIAIYTYIYTHIHTYIHIYIIYIFYSVILPNTGYFVYTLVYPVIYVMCYMFPLFYSFSICIYYFFFFFFHNLKFKLTFLYYLKNTLAINYDNKNFPYPNCFFLLLNLLFYFCII